MLSSMCYCMSFICLFFFNDTATTEIYTLSLHDALPIWRCRPSSTWRATQGGGASRRPLGRTPISSRRSARSEEHTSELQSQSNLVCRLLLEKKKKTNKKKTIHSLITNHKHTTHTHSTHL